METRHLILKYLSGKASQDERRTLEAWIAESNDNKSLFEDMKSIDEESKHLNKISLVDTDLEWNKFLKKVNVNESAKVISLPKQEKEVGLSKSVFRRRFALAAAASLILILGAVFLFPNKFIEVNSGSESLAVNLDDGTKIELAPNSYLKYPKEFDNSFREIFINGDAQINVAKDPSKPFTINSSLTGIEVLGTIIDLVATEESSKLGVIEGKVNMYSQEDKSISVIAKTGDVILYTSEGFKDLTPPPTPPPKVEEKPEPKPEPKQEVIVKDTVVTEEVKDTVVAEEPEQPRGKFLLHTFIEHLKNTHPEKDKFKTKRGLKYNKKDTVKVTIAASLSTILKQLEEQYNIEYSEDCEDCYEIIGISPKE